MVDKDTAQKILNYLKTKGERHDTEIAREVGISLARTRTCLDDLAGNGDLVSCVSIKFVKNQKIEGSSWRLAGVLPPMSPGRKSKPHVKAE